MNIREFAKKALWNVMEHSLDLAAKQQKLMDFEGVISDLGIDLSKQYTKDFILNDVTKRKIENEHSFQIGFTLKAVNWMLNKGAINSDYASIVDIGDSAGTHSKYLKYFLKDRIETIDCTSVNLDPVAIEKITRGGGTAVLCRAEDYSADRPVTLYLSFEMIEHLHNPAIFFHKMASADNGQYMVVTMPYVKTSRVSAEYMNDGGSDKVYAEDVHIFELCPEDWEKIALHGGWKTIHKDIYYQYPTRHVLSSAYKMIWRKFDFEGFLALFLERDMSQADRYQDWEE